MDMRVGKVTHYFDRISVAVLDLSDELKVGETIHIHGRTTDFIQRVGSLEIEHQKIQSAKPKDEVALKVLEPVREGDIIYKVVEE
jgi:translation elongation factor EF-1alpha